jgi:hypothetical protein
MLQSYNFIINIWVKSGAEQVTEENFETWKSVAGIHFSSFLLVSLYVAQQGLEERVQPRILWIRGKNEWTKGGGNDNLVFFFSLVIVR